jgi:hypothetical protein
MSKRWRSVPLRTHRPGPQSIRTTNVRRHTQADDEDEYAIVGHMGEGARPPWAEPPWADEDEEPEPGQTPVRQRTTADSTDLVYTGRGTLGSVTRRYTDTRGNTVIEQGKTRYVLHTEPEPGRPRFRSKRRGRGLAVFGLGMLVMIALVTAASAISQHQQAAAEMQAFNQPIITEAFYVVGHNHDSASRPSYFEFINLQGRVLIIELPAGDPAKAMVYTGPQILGESAYTQQVTGEFRDLNGDGRVDLIVTVGGQQQMILLNTGTKFVPQQP